MLKDKADIILIMTDGYVTVIYRVGHPLRNVVAIPLYY